MNKVVAGIDIGATFTKLGIVDQEEDAVHQKGTVGPARNPEGRVRITAPKKCIINIQTR